MVVSREKSHLNCDIRPGRNRCRIFVLSFANFGANLRFFISSVASSFLSPVIAHLPTSLRFCDIEIEQLLHYFCLVVCDFFISSSVVRMENYYIEQQLDDLLQSLSDVVPGKFFYFQPLANLAVLFADFVAI